MAIVYFKALADAATMAEENRLMQQLNAARDRSERMMSAEEFRRTRDNDLVTAWNAGMPVDEMAEALEVQADSVRTIVHRAARRLGVELNRPRTSRASRASGLFDRVRELEAEVERLRAELKKAQAAAYVPRGLYRNSLGAELRVSSAGEPWVATLKRAGFRVLTGDIAVATSHDDLFGTWHYLVTNASLRECGYELVEPEACDE